MKQSFEMFEVRSLANIAERSDSTEGWDVELEVSVPVVRMGPFRSRAMAAEFRDLVLGLVRHTGREVYVDVRKVGP